MQSVPTYDWPRAPFPELKFPYANYEKENREEEDRCLDYVRNLIKERRDTSKDIAAIIIEPITSFNNKIATPYYFKRLRSIAKENGIPFVVDECKTGMGGTGKFWAHEHWNLKDCPDIVTFGEKSGISGFYSTLDFRLNQFGSYIH